MNQPAYLVHVAIPRPLHDTLSYLLPFSEVVTECDPKDWLGRRVAVPLGKQEIAGVIWQCERFQSEHAATEEPVRFQLRTLHQVCDTVSVVDEHLRKLLAWAARYYHYPLGEVVFTALPLALRRAKPLSKRLQAWLEVSPAAISDATAAKTDITLTLEQQQCLQTMQTWMQAIQPRQFYYTALRVVAKPKCICI